MKFTRAEVMMNPRFAKCSMFLLVSMAEKMSGMANSPAKKLIPEIRKNKKISFRLPCRPVLKTKATLST